MKIKMTLTDIRGTDSTVIIERTLSVASRQVDSEASSQMLPNWFFPYVLTCEFYELQQQKVKEGRNHKRHQNDLNDEEH